MNKLRRSFFHLQKLVNFEELCKLAAGRYHQRFIVHFGSKQNTEARLMHTDGKTEEKDMIKTETMDVYDLCVVGGGMFGSAAARHASANPNLKVCLIGASEPTPEQRPLRDIFGAHYDEGRITRILDVDLSCQILAKRSTERYRELEEKSGIQFYSPVGCLFWGRKNGKYMTNLTASGRSGKVTLINIPDETTLQKRFPFLRMKDDEYALFDDNGGGYVSPRKMVWAQKKVAELQGCKVIDNIVVGISALKDDIHEVETESKGTIKTKRIILATGAFANLKSFEALVPVALKRSKQTVALLEISEEEANRLKSMPSIIRRWEPDTSSPSTIGAYILPPIKYPDGKFYLKFGKSGCPIRDDITTAEAMKQWYLSEGDKDILNTHLDFVTELLPGVKIKSLSTISCAWSHSPSQRPYIDKISPTVTVALAGNGSGAKLSDEIGRIAAHLSTTGKWTSEIPQEKLKVIFEPV